MYTFLDFYQNNIQLSFSDHPFSKEPKHVLVICLYGDKWLLTQHKRRGLEFPGGKVEKEETAQEAAIREVKEETGGMVGEIHYIAQYKVQGMKDTIIKNVYFAKVDKLEKQFTYYETLGPQLLEKLPENIKTNPQFSFIMKDDVLTHCLVLIKKKQNNKV